MQSKSHSQQRQGQQPQNVLSSPPGSAINNFNALKGSHPGNGHSQAQQQFQSLQRSSQQPSTAGLELKLKAQGEAAASGQNVRLINNRQMFQMAPSKKQHPTKMSSSYLQNKSGGLAGGLTVVGQVEAHQTMAGGHKGHTPTHLGTSQSFVRHQALGNSGPVVNGHGIANNRGQVPTQKRGPSAEATCGGGENSLSAKNQFLPAGASGTMRSQSFNPERTAAGATFQQSQHAHVGALQGSGRHFGVNAAAAMNQVNLLANNTTGATNAQGPSRCSAPASGTVKAKEATGTNSLSNFKGAVGGPGPSTIGPVTGGTAGGRQLGGSTGLQEGTASSVTRPGALLATGHGPRGASEGQAKSGSAAPSLAEHSRGYPNPVGTPVSTLLQNRKDQQHYLSGQGAGTAPNSQAHSQHQDLSNKQMNKAPSGKELGQKSLLNLQNVSKSVDKQATGPAGAVASKGAATHQNQQQNYLVLNSNKDIKVRESAKRRREASGASNGGAASGQGYANHGSNGPSLKEKRLSQHQAQQFVNNQFNSTQSNGVGRGLLPNLAANGATGGANGSSGGAQNSGAGQGSSAPAPPQLVSCGTTIIIHVCDENKKLNKDFKCDKQLLITNMKYFEKYLSDSKSADDIDISVHCDINIFDWLMRYIHRKEPTIEVKNSVSILISSDFLQMDDLVEEALNFVARKIGQIIQLPIDMNCMNGALQKRLAGKLSLWDLNELHDKKDKLKSKLFMKKLEYLFEEEHNMLQRCVNCGSLYTSNQREWVQCPQANLFIDYHGNTIAKHQSDKHWDINKFVMFLRQKQISWQDIFWKMFARLQEFRCTHCDKKFLGAEINHCSYHPSKVNFNYQENTTRYPCCNSRAQRFNAYIPDKGCTSQNHRIKAGSPRKTVAQRAKNYELIMEHFKVACEPFYYSKEDANTGEIVTKPKYADMIDEDKSLLNLAAQFVKQNPKHIQESEARAAKEAKREARLKHLELQVERLHNNHGKHNNHTQEQANANSQVTTQNAETGTGTDEKECKAGSAESSIIVEKPSATKPSSRMHTLSNKYEYLLDSASLDNISNTHQGGGNGNGELDLNDELQAMQDFNCFNIFRRKVKKGRKYKEWKKDEIRDGDADQMRFLEKQIHRMRKKEENQVQRKTVAKRNTYGVSHHHHAGPGNSNAQYQNGSGADQHQQIGRPVSTQNPPQINGHHQHCSNNHGQNSSNFASSNAAVHGSGGNHGGAGMGMNMRTRLKLQQNNQQAGHYMQPRQRSNGTKGGTNMLSAHRKV